MTSLRIKRSTKFVDRKVIIELKRKAAQLHADYNKQLELGNAQQANELAKQFNSLMDTLCSIDASSPKWQLDIDSTRSLK